FVTWRAGERAGTGTARCSIQQPVCESSVAVVAQIQICFAIAVQIARANYVPTNRMVRDELIVESRISTLPKPNTGVVVPYQIHQVLCVAIKVSTCRQLVCTIYKHRLGFVSNAVVCQKPIGKTLRGRSAPE